MGRTLPVWKIRAAEGALADRSAAPWHGDVAAGDPRSLKGVCDVGHPNGGRGRAGMPAFSALLALLLLTATSGCGLLGADGEDAATPAEVAEEELPDAGGDVPDVYVAPDIAIDTFKPETLDADASDAPDLSTEDEVDGDSDSGPVDVVFLCVPGQAGCDKGQLGVCNANGDGYENLKDCDEGYECQDALCVVKKICEANQDFCKDAALHTCNVLGNGSTEKQVCAEGKVCDTLPGKNGAPAVAACYPTVCAPDAEICDGDLLTTCNAKGSAPTPGGTDCAKDAKSCVVVDGKSQCKAPSCGDGKVNQKSEDCDLGADNGGIGKSCDESCKTTAGKCKLASDCAGFAGPCIGNFVCVTGLCLGIAKSSGPCNDSDACTLADHCVQGECIGLAANCDDDNDCTADSCEAKVGCAHKGKSGAPCEDGNPCTVGDTCGLGSCKSGSNACPTCKVDADCAAFEDGNLCNGTLTCMTGSCEPKPQSAITCAAGVCLLAVADAAACSKALGKWIGSTCLEPKALDKGACDFKKGSWLEAGPCRAIACDPAQAICVAKDAPDATACDDGTVCTAGDVCLGGHCKGTALGTAGLTGCDDGNVCTADSCDAKDGCKYAPLSQTDSNQAPCDDGDPSSSFDQCKQGVCSGTASVECKVDGDCASDSLNACQGQLTCVAATGKCKLDPATKVVCDPSADTPCAKAVCDPKDGKCKASPAPAGSPCGDGNACTLGDLCGEGEKAGECVGGSLASCDDGNPCTDDVCMPKVGCQSAPGFGACDDGNPCSDKDACASGSCVGGVNVCECLKDDECAFLEKANLCKGGWKCNISVGQCMFDPLKVVLCGGGVCADFKGVAKAPLDESSCNKASGTWKADGACALTSCDPSVGACKQQVASNGSACSDGSACTLGDACVDGVCSAKPNLCDDANPCTDTACQPTVAGGCLYQTAVFDDKPCDDGNDCTKGEVCTQGKCKGGTKPDCNDGDPCTVDGCLAGKGCVHTPSNGLPCDDENACTLEDSCDGATGKCLPGKKIKACGDGNICTDDSCDPKNKQGGCVFAPNDKPCDNQDVCNKGDACAVGLCKAGTETLDCDDKNACTSDACDAKQGCGHLDKAGACTDDDACTHKDECKQAKCVGVAVVCTDDNVCTEDICDKKTGCAYPNTQGDCGPFASCVQVSGKGACAFHSSKHVVFSEIYFGDPTFGDDDFVELYNALTQVADLDGFVLQGRPPASSDAADWATLHTFAAGTKMLPGGFLLLGGSAKTVGNVAVDIVVANWAPDVERGQLRLYDAKHTLVHDRLSWGDATAQEGKALAPWFSANAMERKMVSSSTAADLWWNGGKAWLGGNGHDSDDNAADFVARLAPEPQGSGRYEPACQGICTSGKVCDYKGVLSDSCVTDSTCLQGCGGGQQCSASLGGCVAGGTQGRIVISEVVPAMSDDPAARFIEIHNAGKQPSDITGFIIEVKGPETNTTGAWQPQVAQVPARTVLPAGGYFLFGTAAFAKRGGGVDAIGAIGIVASGGAVRVRDPRTDVELDRFGWGQTKSQSGTPLNVGQGIGAGLSMTRKASSSSNGVTLAGKGKERLSGNAIDTHNDNADFVVVLEPSPTSYHSGAYGPACGGSCAEGLVCNFVPGAEKCADPNCNGQCGMGEVCNVKNEKCDLSVVFSEVSVIGPAGQSPPLSPAENKFIVIYNPAKVPVSVGGMVIQQASTANGFFSGWGPATLVFPTGLCTNSKNNPCEAGETCKCEGAPSVLCTGHSECKGTYIDAGGHLLVTSKKFDAALPTPDLVSDISWNFPSNSGVVRLVRSDGKSYASGSIVADIVAWGAPVVSQGFATTLQSHEAKLGCSYRRKPWPGALGSEVGDPNQAAHYGGAAWKGSSIDKAWVIACPKAPRNAAAPALAP